MSKPASENMESSFPRSPYVGSFELSIQSESQVSSPFSKEGELKIGCENPLSASIDSEYARTDGDRVVYVLLDDIS